MLYVALISHSFMLADSPGKFDEVVEDKGVKVVVEPKALMTVIGTTVDFVEERLK